MQEGVVIGIVILAVIVVAKGVKQIPQGSEYTVERLGRYTRTLTPGLHTIIPFIDSIGAKLNMMEQVLDVPSQEVITKDNALVTVDGVVFFQILDAAKAAYEVTGEDCLAGTRVTVTGVDGVVLLVACIGSGSCPAAL